MATSVPSSLAQLAAHEHVQHPRNIVPPQTSGQSYRAATKTEPSSVGTNPASAMPGSLPSPQPPKSQGQQMSKQKQQALKAKLAKAPFTPAQLQCLKAQIAVLRKFRHQEYAIAEDLLRKCRPASDGTRDVDEKKPLTKEEKQRAAQLKEEQRKATKIVAAEKKQKEREARQAEKEAKQAEEAARKARTKTDNDPAARKPGVPHKGPLFRGSVNPLPAGTTPTTQFGFPTLADVADIVLQERQRLLSRCSTAYWAALRELDETSTIPGKFGGPLTEKQDSYLACHLRMEKLRTLQKAMRWDVEQCQQEIMAMTEREYRKFVREREKERADMVKFHVHQKIKDRENFLREAREYRKQLREGDSQARNLRESRNKHVIRYHEKMARELAKTNDDDARNQQLRLEAIKSKDLEAYRELIKQQTPDGQSAEQRFSVLSQFLTTTEEYLRKLGSKVAAVKAEQEKAEAANHAYQDALSRGLTAEEAQLEADDAAGEAGEKAAERLESDAQALGQEVEGKYYSVAHSVSETITRQPAMLKAGNLRPYQMVGLQWMISLYNNHLNGILADEMGLGKTVQVMALIAYLFESKANYGPHLIIVPNAVVINWKAEFVNWLGDKINAIMYVGHKDERAKLFEKVMEVKFNVLVTSFEFIMRDRSKLSRISWKYIIIDEAHRMKDRKSKLSRDLEYFTAQRRLLLTGTPLQNDLMELWALLNLLLPDVFDSSDQFGDWFSKAYADNDANPEDQWLEKEKKVIVVHRLHQILEPFMLRRLVEDVEQKLPPKVTYTVKSPFSPLQSSIYHWVKRTQTLRVDPEAPVIGKQGQREYASLQNKFMELRKCCNHPFLVYPSAASMEAMVRTCGKMYLLDRLLTKMRRTGHRVLLFSTMTKMLDLLEVYCRWRFGPSCSRRIDGSTSLEARESSIIEFNAKDSSVFIFLLSIRAAGRGLNLQTADTVVVYDPDPNPKNEEQAVARAHRIGQKKEVRVFHFESVSEQDPLWDRTRVRPETFGANIKSGKETEEGEEELRYVPSIETIVRDEIQQQKIDMADEVINAGHFDQNTSQAERRAALETLLHEYDRGGKSEQKVPSLQEFNRMLARSPEELNLFDKMDREEDWPGSLLDVEELPQWLRPTRDDVERVYAVQMKDKKGKAGLLAMETLKKLNGDSDDEHPQKRRRQEKKYSEPGSDDEFLTDSEDESRDTKPSIDTKVTDASAGVSIPPVPLMADKSLSTLGESKKPFDPQLAERRGRPENERLPDSQIAKCFDILAKLKSFRNEHGHQIANAFIRLPTPKELPDYYEHIKKPMDFERIEERLQRGRLGKMKEFEGLVRLMFANARLYNAEGSFLYVAANTLEHFFDNYWKNLKSEQPEMSLMTQVTQPREEPSEQKPSEGAHVGPGQVNDEPEPSMVTTADPSHKIHRPKKEKKEKRDKKERKEKKEKKHKVLRDACESKGNRLVLTSESDRLQDYRRGDSENKSRKRKDRPEDDAEDNIARQYVKGEDLGQSTGPAADTDVAQTQAPAIASSGALVPEKKKLKLVMKTKALGTHSARDPCESSPQERSG